MQQLVALFTEVPLAVPAALHGLINRNDLEEVTAAIFKLYGSQVDWGLRLETETGDCGGGGA